MSPPLLLSSVLTLPPPFSSSSCLLSPFSVSFLTLPPPSNLFLCSFLLSSPHLHSPPLVIFLPFFLPHTSPFFISCPLFFPSILISFFTSSSYLLSSFLSYLLFPSLLISIPLFSILPFFLPPSLLSFLPHTSPFLISCPLSFPSILVSFCTSSSHLLSSERCEFSGLALTLVCTGFFSQTVEGTKTSLGNLLGPVW